MFFKRSKEKKIKCAGCDSKIDKKFSFCPHCGAILLDENEAENYGLLGKNDINIQQNEQESFGITDKLLGSLMNTLVKTLDKQFKELEKQEKFEVRSLPNGIKIRIGPAMQNTQVQNQNQRLPKMNITDEQLKRMSTLPRASAKTAIRRLSDRIVYELNVPGIISANDVFISKLESGYEVKAIGDKVYTNTLPVTLPLRSMSVDKSKISIEFVNQ